MWIFEPLVEFFVLLWVGDDRREARWFTVGCLVVVLVVIGIIALVYMR